MTTKIFVIGCKIMSAQSFNLLIAKEKQRLNISLLIVVVCLSSFTVNTVYAQVSDPEAAKSLRITEVELSPPSTGDSNDSIWVEVHNPTDKTFLTPVEIRTLEGFSFSLTSTTFRPDEYKVFEVWDNSNTDQYPNDNAVLILYTSSEETDRTPPLTDTFTDSRTWQLNGTEWEFTEATPMREIPEFGSIAMVVIVVGITVAIFATKRFTIKW